MREMLIVSRSKVEQSTLDDLRDGWLGRRPIFGSKNGGTAVPFGQRLRFERKSLLFMRACFPGGKTSYLYDRYLIVILLAFILPCCFYISRCCRPQGL